VAAEHPHARPRGASGRRLSSCGRAG
jgi:hypothetical protein